MAGEAPEGVGVHPRETSSVTQVNTVIGVDCATQEKRVGLAWAERLGGGWVLRDATLASSARPVAHIVSGWLAERSGKALLALDAPLGWPSPMKAMLLDHRAGERVRGEPNHVFRREGDRFVASLVGKTPLDVGADRIARTAHWALCLLENLRVRVGEPIPLAWEVAPTADISAIEVYPAATLLAHGLSLKGYKAAEGIEARRRLLPVILEHLEWRGRPDDLIEVPDVFDATVCVLAALDFLEGRAVAPTDLPLARDEGWIWVARPDA